MTATQIPYIIKNMDGKQKDKTWVHAGSYGWINVARVEFVDIEESFRGFDVMTFNYFGEEYKSKVSVGNKPA